MAERISGATVAAMILALILGACGGTPRAAVPERDNDSTEQAASTDKASAQTQSPDDGASDLTKKRHQATFKVSYKWTTSTSKGSSATYETWYSKPPKSRVDFGEANADNWLAQFALEDGLYGCMMSAGKPSCSKVSDENASAEESSTVAAFMTAFEGILTDKTIDATRDTRTIVGQRASCARATNVVVLGFAEITVCYASNGVPLLLDWKSGSDVFRMEATSYATNVSDRDFELPAKP